VRTLDIVFTILSTEMDAQRASFGARLPALGTPRR
jgi:hypothetical protein